MAKKLYVGGLPYATTDAELKEAFAKAGSVDSATIIMDKMTGRSKGFGFVEMSSDEEAQAAIDMWNGKDFGGRTLTVNEARPLEARPPRREYGGDRGGYSGGGYGGGNRGGGRW
ncbi:RNA-binding protein [bacterium]|nr:RNA-binding protein [bacterium]